MTLVFKTPIGSLIQVQIGPADIITTISAAYSATGWLGGLDGIRFMLSKASEYIRSGNKSHYTTFEDLVDNQLQLQDSSFHIITSEHGPVQRSLSNADDAFGGDKVTQMIGMTICALAHELGGPCAVDLFMEFIVPGVFEGVGVIDALHGKLREEDVLQRLLNEGVTRGLPDLFLESVTKTGLPEINSEYYRIPHLDDTGNSAHSELGMVAGLLKWIIEHKRDPYLTRSGLVARTACYLKAVGYNVGSVQRWDGFPPFPRASGPRAIILVLGGSEATDQFMTEPVAASDYGLQLHYTFYTVGSVLHQALAPAVIIRPETLQTEFEYIFEFIASHLQSYYSAPLPPRIPEAIEATLIWSKATEKSTSSEIRLASLHFPLIAEQIAPCYRRIVSDRLLDRVLETWSRRGDGSVLTKEDAQFRATTAAIVICLVSRLSSTDFKAVRHSVSQELLSLFGLGQICGIINRGFSSSLTLNEAVGLVALIHTGIMDLWKLTRRIESSDRIIGWRNGMYCVLPTLLLNMKPSASSVTLACKDVFYANVRTHNDGSIRDSESSALFPDLSYLHQDPFTPTQQSVTETLHNFRPWIGPARRTILHQPLYLNIERPVQFRDSDVCLAGRLDGNIIGIVSVVNVLASISRSVEVPLNCSHDDIGHPPDVLNINTSVWLKARHVRPAGSAETPAYLDAHNNHAWALFAAGECAYFHHSIVFGCLSCSKEAVAHRVDNSREEGVVLIGYQ